MLSYNRPFARQNKPRSTRGFAFSTLGKPMREFAKTPYRMTAAYLRAAEKAAKDRGRVKHQAKALWQSDRNYGWAG